MLAIEVEYLMGRSWAGSFISRDEGEWPPHPGRLFSALVAASHSHDTPAAAQQALAWLERQDAPAIHAPQALKGDAVTAFVPPNYPPYFSKQGRQFPSVLLREAVVYFVWADANPDEVTREQLEALTARVGYLGRSTSLVRASLCGEPPEPNLLPDAEGEASLRVPVAGRLEELDEAFQNDLRPGPGARQAYRDSVTRPEIGASLFGELAILRKTSPGDHVPVAGTLMVTGRVREALIKIADEHGLGCPAIHGHEAGSLHVAYLALPFVGAPHADGRILGIGIAIPRELESEQKRRVREAVSKLSELKLGPAGVWTLGTDADTWPVNLRARTWSGPARHWISATPVLMDRFPKKKLSVEAIIVESCRRIGLPKPVAVEHGIYPMMSGVPAVPEFKLQRKEKPRAEWGVHVKVTFGEAVRGPVLLGRGRFFGLGLMRPVPETAT